MTTLEEVFLKIGEESEETEEERDDRNKNISNNQRRMEKLDAYLLKSGHSVTAFC